MTQYRVYRLRRARNIRITVRRDGSVRISAPLRAAQHMIDDFVARNAAWIAAAHARLRAAPRARIGDGTPAEYAARKHEALTLVKHRLAHFNAHYGLAWKRVSVRNQRSRWGSCSRTGTLSFCYRIVLLPPALADYLVVHELCHLRYMHHGPHFWALVAHAVPNWRECRRRLREML